MNEENLKPFKKGQSGNPAGKPKGTKNFKTLFNKYLDVKLNAGMDEFNESGQPQKARDILVINLIKNAVIDNDMYAIREILDRVEGKPIQSTIVENIDNNIKTDDEILNDISILETRLNDINKRTNPEENINNKK